MPPAPLRKAFIHPVKMDSGRGSQVNTCSRVEMAPRRVLWCNARFYFFGDDGEV